MIPITILYEWVFKAYILYFNLIETQFFDAYMMDINIDWSDLNNIIIQIKQFLLPLIFKLLKLTQLNNYILFLITKSENYQNVDMLKLILILYWSCGVCSGCL